MEKLGEIEIWKAVKGASFYEVSSFGRVRSWLRVGRPRRRREKETHPRYLKLTLNNTGYPRIRVSYDDGENKSKLVHVLMSEVFLKPFSGCHVNHIDGLKSNNKLSNLECVTRRENMAHAHRIGLYPYARGESHNRSKLSLEQVNDIRKILKIGRSTEKEIASIFCVSRATINRIRNKNHWSAK